MKLGKIHVHNTGLLLVASFMLGTVHGFTRCLAKDGESQYIRGPADFFAAESDCLSRGQFLLSLHTAEDRIFITSFLTNNGVEVDIMLGINDELTKNKYLWSDGTVEKDWSEFYSTKPSQDRQPNCLRMSHNTSWTWFDQPCTETHHYICEQKILPVHADPSNVCTMIMANPDGIMKNAGSTLALSATNSITLTCDPEYTKGAVPSVTCLDCDAPETNINDFLCDPRPCPVFTEANAIAGYTGSMVFGEETDVTCSYSSGYLTASGETKFTVTCGYSGTMVLENLQTCQKVTCGGLMVLNSNTTGQVGSFGDQQLVTCNEGYRVEENMADFTVTCHIPTDNVALVAGHIGQWSGLEKCLPIPCGALEVANASIHTPDLNYTLSTVVQCNTGYLTNTGLSNFTVACNLNSTTGHVYLLGVTTCDIVTCPSTLILNSDINILTASYGYSVAATCLSGYQTNGGNSAFSINCTLPETIIETETASSVFGVWNGVQQCVARPCPQLSVEYSNTTSVSGNFGDQLVVVCNDGYHISEGAHNFTTECNIENESEIVIWTGLGICRVRACPPLIAPNNIFSKAALTYGENATVTCDRENGYLTSTGQQTFTVNCSYQDGIMYHQGLDTCNLTYCANLTIPNSNVSELDSSVGVSISAECDVGYQANGKSMFTVSCVLPTEESLAPNEQGSFGTWINSQYCTAIPCPSLLVANSDTYVANGSYGDNVTVTCAPGHHVEEGITSYNASCSANGSWEGASHCIAMPCPSFTVSGGSAEAANLTFGESTVVTCAHGYLTPQKTTSFNMTCAYYNYTAQLQGLSSCDLITCEPPDQLFTNIIASEVVGNLGTEVTLRCSAGYGLINGGKEFNVSCFLPETGIAVWNNTEICQVRSCDTLRINNSDIKDGINGTFGSVIPVACDAGYELTSPYSSHLFNVTCGESESGLMLWDGLQQCAASLCADLAIVNGTVSQVRLYYGDTSEITCQAGHYTLEGKSTYNVTCSVDVSTRVMYHQNVQSCMIPTCDIAAIPHTNITNTTMTGDERMLARCDEGYHMLENISHFVLMCDGLGISARLENETFYNQTLSAFGVRELCKPMPCSSFDAPGGNATHLVYGTNSTVACNPGYYTSSGDSSFVLSCILADSETIPSLSNQDICTEHCPPITIDHSHILDIHLHVGGGINVTCHEGFKSEVDRIQCVTVSELASWAPINVSCVAENIDDNNTTSNKNQTASKTNGSKTTGRPTSPSTAANMSLTNLNEYFTATNRSTLNEYFTTKYVTLPHIPALNIRTMSWNLWSHWTQCSLRCGRGSHVRVRVCRQGNSTKCSGTLAAIDGVGTIGFMVGVEDCGLGPCPVDGMWAEWASWSMCSSTCGPGVTSRRRACEGPRHGGKKCGGEHLQREVCNPQECVLESKVLIIGEADGLTLTEQWRGPGLVLTESDDRVEAIGAGVITLIVLISTFALIAIIDSPTYILQLKDSPLYQYIKGKSPGQNHVEPSTDESTSASAQPSSRPGPSISLESTTVQVSPAPAAASSSREGMLADDAAATGGTAVDSPTKTAPDDLEKHDVSEHTSDDQQIDDDHTDDLVVHTGQDSGDITPGKQGSLE